jgi:putative redox protein
MATETAGSRDVIVEGDASGFAQRITIGVHQFAADESLAAGGTETGPDPYQLLLAALGSCTSMTVAMYAGRKQWPLTRVRVQLAHGKSYAEDCAHCDTGPRQLDRIERALEFDGPLTTEQRRRLIEIAEKCPVHRTLASCIHIVTRLVEPSPER